MQYEGPSEGFVKIKQTRKVLMTGRRSVSGFVRYSGKQVALHIRNMRDQRLQKEYVNSPHRGIDDDIVR